MKQLPIYKGFGKSLIEDIINQKNLNYCDMVIKILQENDYDMKIYQILYHAVYVKNYRM